VVMCVWKGGGEAAEQKGAPAALLWVGGAGGGAKSGCHLAGDCGREWVVRNGH
jgi:hypothetical protein